MLVRITDGSPAFMFGRREPSTATSVTITQMNPLNILNPLQPKSLSQAATRLGFPVFSAMGPEEVLRDFAGYPLRCEKNDCLLTQRARFLLGITSGSVAPALAQGIPFSAVCVVLFGALKVWGPRDVAILKFLRIAGAGGLRPSGISALAIVG